MSHSQTLSLSRNLQSMKKIFFFYPDRGKPEEVKLNQIIFENFLRTLSSFAVKLHCVDVNFFAPLDDDKKESEHMEGLHNHCFCFSQHISLL